MTKSIVRGHKQQLVDQCFGDKQTRFYITKMLERIIRAEIKKMCSRHVNSVLQITNPEALATFQWDSLLAELKSHAPTLLSVLSAAVYKKENATALIGVCCAVLFKSRNTRMSLFQKLVAMILHVGHCSKQVYNNSS